MKQSLNDRVRYSHQADMLAAKCKEAKQRSDKEQLEESKLEMPDLISGSNLTPSAWRAHRNMEAHALRSKKAAAESLAEMKGSKESQKKSAKAKNKPVKGKTHAARATTKKARHRWQQGMLQRRNVSGPQLRHSKEL